MVGNDENEGLALIYRQVARKNNVNAHIILPGGCVWSLDTYFNLSQIYHVYVLFVDVSYQARLLLQISYPAILFTMLIGFFNFIVHVLLPGTSKALTLSFFLLGAWICVVLSGTQRYNWWCCMILYSQLCLSRICWDWRNSFDQ